MINNTKLDGIIIDSTFDSTYHMIDAQLVLFSFFIDKIEKIMSLLYCSFQICTIFIKKTFWFEKLFFKNEALIDLNSKFSN